MDTPTAVVTVGTDLLAAAVESQAVPVTRVDWRPPMAGTEDDLVAVATDPLRADANARALAAMLEVQATLVDVAPASEVLGLEPGEFLHAGPPIAWDRASGPLRGALMGGAALEGLVEDPEDAVALFESGSSVSLEPCHHRGAVGPMAGVVTPSMWMWVLEDARTGRRTFCSLNEGLGKVLRYGAYGPEVLERLRWMGEVLGPLLQAAVRSADPVDVTGILTQMLQMGDEAHNRNRAGTLMLLRDLAPAMVRAGGSAATSRRRCGSSAATTTSSSTWPCPRASSRSTPPAASRGRPWSWRWPATAPTSASRSPAPATSGSPDRPSWPTASTSATSGPTTPTPTSATPRSPRRPASAASRWRPRPRSCASSAAPCPTRWPPPGGCTRSPSARTRAGRCRCWSSRARRPASTSPRSAAPASCPRSTPGMAGRVAGVGQVGAGLVTPPAEIFPAALRRLAELARLRS